MPLFVVEGNISCVEVIIILDKEVNFAAWNWCGNKQKFSAAILHNSNNLFDSAVILLLLLRFAAVETFFVFYC